MILELAGPKHAFFSGKTWSYKDLIKVVPGAAWEPHEKRWQIPIESVQDAKRILPSLKLSEAIERIHREVSARNKKAVELKSADESKATTTVKGLKGTLRPYQAVGKAFLDVLQHGEGSILAFDMGLGKSLTALATFLDWKNRGIVDYCLVICPAPLKYSTWEKEVQKWTNLEVVIVDGDKSEVVEWEDGTKEKMKGRNLREIQYLQYQYGADVIVMNYELFLHDSEVDMWDKVRDLTPEEIEEYTRLATEHNDANGRKADSAKGLAAASKIMAKKLIPSEAKEHKIYGKKKPCLAKRRVVNNIIPRIDGRWCIIMDECFPYDTEVILANGARKKIGDIVEQKIPCEVRSYNVVTGAGEVKPVVSWHKNVRKNRLVKVTLDNGYEVKMTENHKVYTVNRGYVLARELTSEDEVVLNG